jgi:hypothetical protein
LEGLLAKERLSTVSKKQIDAAKAMPRKATTKAPPTAWKKINSDSRSQLLRYCDSH